MTRVPRYCILFQDVSATACARWFQRAVSKALSSLQRLWDSHWTELILSLFLLPHNDLLEGTVRVKATRSLVFCLRDSALLFCCIPMSTYDRLNLTSAFCFATEAPLNRYRLQKHMVCKSFHWDHTPASFGHPNSLLLVLEKRWRDKGTSKASKALRFAGIQVLLPPGAWVGSWNTTPVYGFCQSVCHKKAMIT